jgi:malonyl-CoA O-methyltransferase
VETPSTLTRRRDAEPLSTQAGYDRWADVYDEEDNPLIALEAPRTAALLGDVRGLEVVDLGCGTGRHALRMVAEGARVTAIDFSAPMTDRAAQKTGWSDVRLISHDLMRPLPLADRAFDRVLCALVLDHIAELPAFFGECGRICRPDGFIVVSVMHPAMMLRGVQAHFTDPTTGREVRPASVPNQLSDYVMGVVRAGLRIEHLGEHAVDADLASRHARAAKYLGWPMLLLMRLYHESAKRDARDAGGAAGSCVATPPRDSSSLAVAVAARGAAEAPNAR